MKKIYLFYIVFLYCALTAFAQVQSEGEKLFRLNKPEAAIPVLEKEISLQKHLQHKRILITQVWNLIMFQMTLLRFEQSYLIKISL